MPKTLDNKESKKNDPFIEMQDYSSPEEQPTPALTDKKVSSLPTKPLEAIDTLTLSNTLLEKLLKNPLDLSELINFDLFRDFKDLDIVKYYQETPFHTLMRNNITDRNPLRENTKKALIELARRAFAVEFDRLAFAAEFDCLAQVTLCHLILHQAVTCSPYRANQLSALTLPKLKSPKFSHSLELISFLSLLKYLNIMARRHSPKNNIDLLHRQLERQSIHLICSNKLLTAYFTPAILKKVDFDFKENDLNQGCLLFALMGRFTLILEAFHSKGMGSFNYSTQLEIANRALPIHQFSARKVFELATCDVLFQTNSTFRELRTAYELIIEGMKENRPFYNNCLTYSKMGKYFEWGYFRALHYKDKHLAHDFIYHAVKFYQMSRHTGYLAELAPAVIRLFTLRHVMDDEKSNYRIRHTRYLQLLKKQYPDLYEKSIQSLYEKHSTTQSAKPDLDSFTRERMQENSEDFISNVNGSLSELLPDKETEPSLSQPYRQCYYFLKTHRWDLMAEASYPSKKVTNQIKANIQNIFSQEQNSADKINKRILQQQVTDFFHHLDENIKHTCKLITSVINPYDYLLGLKSIYYYCKRKELNHSALTLLDLTSIVQNKQNPLVPACKPCFPLTFAEGLMIAFVDLKESIPTAPAHTAEVKNLRGDSKRTSIMHSHFRKKETIPPETMPWAEEGEQHLRFTP